MGGTGGGVRSKGAKKGTIPKGIAKLGKLSGGTGKFGGVSTASLKQAISNASKNKGTVTISVAGSKTKYLNVKLAPKGVGALYIKGGVTIEPFMHGAGHESGRRAGTENILLDVGLGAACQLAGEWLDSRQIVTLRDYFWQGLSERFGAGVILNGHPLNRLPNTLNVSFVGRSGAEILSRLDGVAASTGSACHSGDVQLSPTLKAMGIPAEIGAGAIRFSLGRGTTRAEIDAVLQKLAAVI